MNNMDGLIRDCVAIYTDWLGTLDEAGLNDEWRRIAERNAEAQHDDDCDDEDRA